MRRFYEIKIWPVVNGIIVEVGCVRFVFRQEDIQYFLNTLHAYMENPEQTEKNLRERYKDWFSSPPVQVGENALGTRAPREDPPPEVPGPNRRL
ncbi:MAG: hypothetical protein LUO93_04290 [Methanomicrobiales archaeon]|nr:hypothetical protein [Methanomicrobiales archaeon]